MLRLTDITFYANSEYAHTADLIKAQHTSLNYIETIRNRADIEVIKHLDNPNTIRQPWPHFHFFSAKNHFFYLPLATLRYLKKRKPDIVMVQGFIFPIQVMAMKLFLGKKVKIMARHHADFPGKGLKRLIQKIADTCIDKYLFTSVGNAEPWLHAGIIRDPSRILEIPATLTTFSRMERTACRAQTGMGDGPDYLWVGRLHANKDPLTVLSAFEQYLTISASAKLHMIYQSDELLPQIKRMLEEKKILSMAVILHGPVPYETLPVWYTAADFFISASYYEGGSAALLEAMSCGCIPVVSAIPASLKVIANGEYGFCFEAGSTGTLVKALSKAGATDRKIMSEKIIAYFEKEYSVAAVTDKLIAACERLVAE